MQRLSRFLAGGALFFAVGCSDATSPTGPPTSSPDLSVRGRANPHLISAMTRNVYIGFDADAAIAALATGDPAIFGPVLQDAVATLGNTDFAARAKAFAGEIALTRPHVVGLQEVYQIHADLSALGIPAVIDLDYLAILQAALAARHLPYVVAAKVIDSDITPLDGIELVDRDVLLVDASRVQVGPDVIAKTFENNIGVIAPGVDKKAGFILAPVTVGGLSVTIVTTHLESDLGPESHPVVSQLRAAQATEIATALGSTPNVVLMGDLNDTPGALMYQVFTGAGLTDTWLALRPRDPGFTDSCFPPDLVARFADCQKRIDFIFERGLEFRRAGLLGTEIRVGILPFERVRGPAGLIWPSDHAGLVGDFIVPPA